jgi:hypothetical protein
MRREKAPVFSSTFYLKPADVGGENEAGMPKERYCGNPSWRIRSTYRESERIPSNAG